MLTEGLPPCVLALGLMAGIAAVLFNLMALCHCP
jgi:hypothetical protein